MEQHVGQLILSHQQQLQIELLESFKAERVKFQANYELELHTLQQTTDALKHNARRYKQKLLALQLNKLQQKQMREAFNLWWRAVQQRKQEQHQIHEIQLSQRNAFIVWQKFKQADSARQAIDRAAAIEAEFNAYRQNNQSRIQSLQQQLAAWQQSVSQEAAKRTALERKLAGILVDSKLGSSSSSSTVPFNAGCTANRTSTAEMRIWPPAVLSQTRTAAV